MRAGAGMAIVSVIAGWVLAIAPFVDATPSLAAHRWAGVAGGGIYFANVKSRVPPPAASSVVCFGGALSLGCHTPIVYFPGGRFLIS